MAQYVTWTVTAPSVGKAQAGVLAVEFWTSQGFEAHSSSYNRLVFRKNGYGNWRAFVDVMFGTEGELSNAPTELTILMETLPDRTTYSLQFMLGEGWAEKTAGDLGKVTRAAVDRFISFVNQWTESGQKYLQP